MSFDFKFDVPTDAVDSLLEFLKDTPFRDLVVCSVSRHYSVMVYVADQRPLLNLASHDWFIRSNDGEWTMEVHQEPTWAGVKVVKKIVGYSPIEWAASY